MPQPQPNLNNFAQLIAELGEKLNLTGEEIADVLWLTLKRQEFTEISNVKSENLVNTDRENNTSKDKKIAATDLKDTDTKNTPLPPPERIPKAPIYTSESSPQAQGLPIRIPDAPSLREPLNFAQSLYPLMRRVNTGNQTIVDEIATVERVASENFSLPVNICFPVLKSEPEPWLDLALVIDESQSMLIWRHTVNELQRLLKNYGIFRDLRVWGIKPNQEGNALQIFSRMGSNHRLSHPKEIIDPTGRRLILVVSDCVSNIWRKGIIFPVLCDWAQKQPLAVIQMLPEWMWRRSALSLGTAVGFSSSIAGVANQDLLVNKKFFQEEKTKVPVLSLEPELAAQWSQMLVGKADAVVPGYLLPTQLNIEEYPLLQRQQEALSSLDSQQRVERFRLNSSPLGRKLAGLLAAAPVINLPIVRLIQESLLPESRQVQVAEVFLGGLLQPKSAQIIEPDTNPDAVEYEFREFHIRDIFLEDAPVCDSSDVLNAVSRYVAEQMGKSLDEFMALLKMPETAGQEKEQVKPFAEVTARILRKLGGDYVEFAQQLEQETFVATELPQLKTILLVEDELNVIEKVSTLLSSEYGITVWGTGDVNEVIQLVKSGEIDLILINYHLPNSYYQGRRFNGIEIIRILKGNPQFSQSLPIVGFSVEEYRREEFLKYADGFYSKTEVLEGSDYQKFVDYLQAVFNRVTQGKFPNTGKHYAITIGINEYRNLGSIPPAQYAVRDAVMMQQWFSHRGFEKVDLLTNESANSIYPTQDGWRYFWLENFPPYTLSAEDTLWFYFSGYGIYRNGQDYLLLTDSNLEIPEETGLSLINLVKQLQSSGAGKIILLLDIDRQLAEPNLYQNTRTTQNTTRNFTFVEVSPLEQQLQGETNLGEGLIIFSASSHKEGAYEIDGLQQGSFTYALREALETTQGNLSMERLEQFLRVRVSELNNQNNLPTQTPQSLIIPPYLQRWIPFPSNLEVFTCKTPTVNRRGEILKEDTKLAQYFTENLGKNVLLEMVAIPGGTFMMGTEDEEIERLVEKFDWERYRSEKPQHKVTLPPFFMGKYPITQAQWKAVAELPRVNCELKLEPSNFKGDNLPVEQVSWYDALEFCARLSKHTGKEYRLPSEAEWEYACRAGTTTPFHFGETITDKLVNYKVNEIFADEPKGEYREQTTPVGQFPPNAFGLYDMHGNVWEWCLDDWHENYEGAPVNGTPWFNKGGNEDNLFQKQGSALLRGGSWSNNPENCRSACHLNDLRAERVLFNNDFGFRVVCGVGRIRQ
ncbi:hypothetical protein NIES4101_55100 [Calothrix sp. NIES-4101]|nr:hypothetical protein NIES4101_55100 [Calothrix sp. NIES-4101]